MARKQKGLTYKASGVDIEASAQMVERAKPLIEKTRGYLPGKLITPSGGYAAGVQLDSGPVLLAATDGVGTKIKVAEAMGVVDTVGIDLVAMCVNDILVYGATAGFFLDYFAMGKQIRQRSDLIMAGIIAGCMQARYALIGGETAEMLAVYGKHGWDLAGFAVGIAPNKDSLIMGDKVRPGMKVFGLASNGLHSNGFSMVWKAFGITFRPRRWKEEYDKLTADYPGIGGPLFLELLRPTKIYVEQVSTIKERYEIAGMAHITGGGLIENPPRTLPPGCAVKIRKDSWLVPPIFPLIQKLGNVAEMEMLRTFNNGIAFIVYSPDEIKEDGVYKIGQVVEGNGEVIFA